MNIRHDVHGTATQDARVQQVKEETLQSLLVQANLKVKALETEIATLKAKYEPVNDSRSVPRGDATDLRDELAQRSSERWKQPCSVSRSHKPSSSVASPRIDAVGDDPQEEMNRRSAERWKQPLSMSVRKGA